MFLQYATQFRQYCKIVACGWMTQSWLNWGFNSSNACERVSSCQLLMGSKWLEAENCFIWNYFCLRNFLTLKDLSSFFVSLAYFLLKIDYFFVQHILIIFSPPSTLLSPSSPTLPSGSTLFLFLIRKLLRANNQT